MIVVLVTALIAFTTGWLGCALFGRVTESSCRRGMVDLTGWSKGDTRR